MVKDLYISRLFVNYHIVIIILNISDIEPSYNS